MNSPLSNIKQLAAEYAEAMAVQAKRAADAADTAALLAKSFADDIDLADDGTTKDAVVSARLPRRLVEALDRDAEAAGVNRSQMMTAIITASLGCRRTEGQQS